MAKSLLMVLLFGVTGAFSQKKKVLDVVLNTPSMDSNSISFKVRLRSYETILRREYKGNDFTENCNLWFTSNLLIIDKLDTLSKKYVKLPCIADIDPVFDLNNTKPEWIILEKNTFYNTEVKLLKRVLPKGVYRFRLKQYYWLMRNKKYALSNYQTFVVS